jgi:hypothetical protein
MINLKKIKDFYTDLRDDEEECKSAYKWYFKKATCATQLRVKIVWKKKSN